MRPFKIYGPLFLISLFGLCQSIDAQEAVKNRKSLDYFIEQADLASPLIKDFSNQLMMNEIDSLRMRTGYRPQVTASSTGMYAPTFNGYGFDQILTNGQSLDALVNVNYALTGKDVKENQTAGWQLQKATIRYASNLSRLDLQKAITDQYILAYSSQQQMDFNLDVYNLLKREEAVLKKLTSSNIYKQTEYLTFLITFKQQQLQFKQAELQFKTDLSTLYYLSGINDNAETLLIEPVLGVARSADLSFFTKRFDIDSLKAVNDAKAISLSYRPKASVYLNSGYNSSLALQPYRNFGASTGFTLAVPIYDGHQKKMQQEKFNLQLQTGSLYRNFFRKQQQQQIEMLNQQIEETEGFYKAINEQIRFTRGVVEVDSKLLHTGDVRIADFVVAINNYMAAQNVLRQTNINRLKLITQLNYWNR